MSEPRIFQIVRPDRFRPRYIPFICIAIFSILICGCSAGFQAKPSFEEANHLFSQGSYQASLNKYEQIIEKYPATGDRALFEMGIIYAHPKNEQKDYQKSLECFQKIIRDYPESGYRQDSEMMIFYINNVSIKDKIINTQQTQIETLQREVKGKENEILASQNEILTFQKEILRLQNVISTLQKKIEALEQKIFAFAIKLGPADRILIEKKERRLMLISNGTVVKTYKIALGGNPVGAKERQGDHKTPEGTYFIDAKNKDSQYHLSLRLSYPNESDKMRATALGVSPGGDIMIHGIKNSLSWVGDAHTEVDWTRGCIAVTDKEIEEINTFAPIGTIVEIRP